MTKAYRNKKTGATIYSPLKIQGGNWAPLEEFEKEEVKKEEVKEVKEVEKEDKEEVVEETSTDLTKKDIIQELEAIGIEYNQKMTKAELLELLEN